MSSPSSSNTQQSITASQQSIAAQQEALAQANQTEGTALMQPLINQLSQITSGSPSALMTAIAPQLTNLTQAQAQTKGLINENIGPGVGRDVAQAQNIQNTQSSIANLKNTSLNNAFTQLAGLGQGIESFGLSDVGSALSGLGGASNSNAATMQAQQASKSSTLGFLGELAGAGGRVGAAFAP